MIFNLVFLIGILIFTIYSYIKGTSSVIFHFIVSVFSLIFAVLVSDFLAAFLANYATFLKLDDTMSIILGSEYVYYKASGFLLGYLLFSLTLSAIFKIFYNDEKFEFNSKLVKINVGIFVGFFQMVVLLSIALSTPYALDYSNKLTHNISNVPGVGTLMNKVTYDYKTYNDILNDNPSLNAAEINITVMEEMVDSKFTTKKKLKKVLKSSHWYSEEVDEWLSN